MDNTRRDGADDLDGLDDLINAAEEGPSGGAGSQLGDRASGFIPLQDDTLRAPLAAAVNPLHSSFVFPRSTASFDALVGGLRTLVREADVGASATQRALAADVAGHLDRVRYLSSLPPLSMGLQAVAHEAAGIHQTAASGCRAGPAPPPTLAADDAPPTSRASVTPSLPTLSNTRSDGVANASFDASAAPLARTSPSSAAALAAARVNSSVERCGRAVTPDADATTAPATSEAPLVATPGMGMASATTHPIENVSGAANESFAEQRVPAAMAVPPSASAALAGTLGAAAAPVARLPGTASHRPPAGTKQTKVNQRIIKLPGLPKDFDEMLAAIRSHWTAGCPERGTPPLSGLVAGTERRATIKVKQVFSASDSCLLSKYKKLAEEAEFMGGWDQFDECLRAERDRWNTAASTEGGGGSARGKRRAFRWAEIVAHVNKRARARNAAAREE